MVLYVGYKKHLARRQVFFYVLLYIYMAAIFFMLSPPVDQAVIV